MPATDDADNNLDQLFDVINPNIYQKIKQTRAARLRKNTRKVPVYYVNQLVFAVDHAPSSAGVTSILKLPTNGPFRITTLSLTSTQCRPRVNTPSVSAMHPALFITITYLLVSTYGANADRNSAGYEPYNSGSGPHSPNWKLATHYSAPPLPAVVNLHNPDSVSHSGPSSRRHSVAAT
jgi:hypothetical protein